MYKLDIKEKNWRSNCQYLLDDKKAREFQNICFIDWSKTFVWITTNCGKFLERWEYQTTLPISWEMCMQVKKQQLELNMEQQTGSKLRKEYDKAVYCHPAYLTYMQSTPCEVPDWMNHKLESRLLGEISTTSDVQTTPPSWQEVKRHWRALDESERGERKTWLETQHSKN